jgi:hypothetical protein
VANTHKLYILRHFINIVIFLCRKTDWSQPITAKAYLMCSEEADF